MSETSALGRIVHRQGSHGNGFIFQFNSRDGQTPGISKTTLTPPVSPAHAGHNTNEEGPASVMPALCFLKSNGSLYRLACEYFIARMTSSLTPTSRSSFSSVTVMEKTVPLCSMRSMMISSFTPSPVH
jgi:hypothetical protein